MKMRMINTALAVFCLLQMSLFAGNQVDIRFANSTFDNYSKYLFVEIQVKARNNSVVLAGQNYRIYYDAENLSLIQENTELNLPNEKYSSLQFHSTVEGVDADGVGKLEFDDNLGFINFSVDLVDQKFGGIIVDAKEDWTSIATLKFKVKGELNDYQLIWGRDGMSNEYATAYVEMAEWLAPRKIQSLEIMEFIDLNYSKEEEFVEDITNFEFGPNPAREFINIEFNNELVEESELMIYDMSGSLMSSINIVKGTTKTPVDISVLGSGNYLLEIKNSLRTIRANDQLIKM